jgi:hypothetical protein
MNGGYTGNEQHWANEKYWDHEEVHYTGFASTAVNELK